MAKGVNFTPENQHMKPSLTIEKLVAEAKTFCETTSSIPELFGVTDGKAIGTIIEHKFKRHLTEVYEVVLGNSASGIDLPGEAIQTDIKVTSIKQPQSSCPFKDAKQKIFGLGYNLLVFVYDKKDDHDNKSAILDFVSCSFIEEKRTGDYTTTFRLREMVKDGAIAEDIFAFLSDRNIPADEMTLMKMAEQILKKPPEQGYLTISNALQWRLQYQRIVNLHEAVNGITKITDKVKL